MTGKFVPFKWTILLSLEAKRAPFGPIWRTKDYILKKHLLTYERRPAYKNGV
jgi:hypothetical protein